jgi:hypothetical protein
MASVKRELERKLRDRNWTLYKQGAKHALYSNGVHLLQISSGNNISSRNERNFLADVKRMDKDKAHIEQMNELLACLRDECAQCKSRDIS